MKIIAHKLNIKILLAFFLLTSNLFAQQSTVALKEKSAASVSKHRLISDNADTKSEARSSLAPSAAITGNFSICLPGPNTTQLTGPGTPAAVNPWVSSATAVATIDNAGLVTAVAFGVTTIQYTDNLGNIFSANVYVSTFPTITSPSGLFKTCAAGTLQLAGSNFPNATLPWESLDPGIATVDSFGLVTGVSGGVARILYRNLGGCTVIQNVTIDPLLSPTITCGATTFNQIIFTWPGVSGASTYTIVYTVNGGPFQFGGFGVATNYTKSGLSPGDRVDIYVTPSGPVGSCFTAGTTFCFTTACTLATSPLAPSITPTNPTCATSTGSVAITPVAGETYNFDGGLFSGTLTYSGLTAGTSHNIIAKNAVGCTSPASNFTLGPLLATPAAPVSGGNITQCVQSPIQTLTATATVLAGETITWYNAASGGAVVASPTLNAIGTVTYYAETNNGSCNSATRTAVTLTINGAPVAPVSGGNVTQCEQSPIQTLTATATVPVGQTITWYNATTGGATVASPTLNSTGTVTYYAEAGNGCPSLTRTAVTLTINAAPAAPVSGGNITQCEQSPIQTLTATATVPVAQTITWYNAATGGATVASPTLNSTGTLTYYAEAGNGCASLTRTAVVLTINAAPTAPVSGGNITQCEQSPIQTLTATATVPVGQTITWYNAATGGATVASPTLNATGTVIYYAEAGNGCASLTRTAVTLTINAAPTAPVSGGNITQCEQSPIQTLTATATVPVGQTIAWYNAASGGATVASPTLNSTGTITYYAEAGNGCASLTRTAVILTINTAPGAPVSGGNITQCEQSPIQTLTATATVPVGQTITWYNAASGGATVASPTLNATGTIIYYAEANNGSCNSTTRTPVTLTINTAPAAPVSGGNITQCEQSPIQTLTATATVPVGQTIAWYNAATGGATVASPTLNATGTITYYAEAGNGCQSPTRTAVTLTIDVAPAAPVSGGNITQCEMSPIQTLTATATVPVGQTVIWYTAASGGATVASPTLNTTGTVTYYAEADNGCPSLTRTAVTLTINSVPAAAPVSGGNITQCEQSPIQTLTATATVPAGQTITWYDAATAGSVVASPTLNTTGTITHYAEANNGCPSLTRTAVILTINPVPAAAPISAGNITQCEQSPIQTLTAAATVPVGQTVIWYNAATGGATVASPTLNTTGTITYYGEANDGTCSSFSRTGVTLTIDTAPTAPVSGGNITQCEQSPIQTLTATASVPVGQTITWYDATTAGSVVASPTLNTTGTITYYAEASDGTCASLTRTAVVLTINAEPNAPVSGGNITQCEQSPIQTLTATASVPVGQTIAWYNAATGGATVASPTLNSTGTITYYAEAGNGCPSLTRTAVILTIDAAPVAPVSGGNITQCEQSPIQTLTATATVPVGQTITWYNATTGGASVASPTLNTTGTITYYAEANDGTCASLTRTAVVLTIDAAPTAPVSGGNITQCEQSPIQTLTATATVPVGQTIDWYTVATGGTAVASPTISTTGTTTYYAEANNGCPSLTRTAVILTINPVPAAAPISGGNIKQCEQSPIQTLTATATVPVGETVIWYDAASAGNTVVTPTLNATGTITYYAEANDGTCSSFNRTPVTLTIDAAPTAPVSGGNITQCEQSPIQTLTAAATVPVGQTITWYNAATGGATVASPTLNTTGTITYYAEANDGTCTSLTRTAVTLTIDTAPAAPVSGGNITQCEISPIQTLTATATVPVGETITWYTAAIGGTTVASPTLNTTGTIIYFVEAGNGCPSLTRTAVTLTINAAPAAPVSGGNITQCEQSPIQTLTATATVPVGQTITWYTAATGGATVASPTLNTTGTITYYAEANDGTCVSLTRTAVTLTIDAAPAAPVSGGNITQCEISPIQTLTATATVPVGETITWYNAATGGATVASPTLNSTGTVTYYAEAGNGCPALTRTAVTLTINQAPFAPALNGNITQCEQSPIQTLNAVSAITPLPGQNVTWYTTPTLGTAVTIPTLNTTGTITYYGESNDGTCPSYSRTAVVLTINAAPAAPVSGGNITQCEQSPIQTLTATASVPVGQTIAWYTAATGGTTVASPTLNTTGTVTYYAQAGNGCASLTRTPVTLTINAAPAAPVSGGNLTICEVSPLLTLTATATV
ncbi:Ig-like domain-containing protein, partial [Flavobacterium sp.]|uniref:Ig-like domain-containing protein n=1 Tax=Flavobacterium sp. TaxID=239 RepID=UPI00260D4955